MFVCLSVIFQIFFLRNISIYTSVYVNMFLMTHYIDACLHIPVYTYVIVYVEAFFDSPKFFILVPFNWNSALKRKRSRDVSWRLDARVGMTGIHGFWICFGLWCSWMFSFAIQAFLVSRWLSSPTFIFFSLSIQSQMNGQLPEHAEQDIGNCRPIYKHGACLSPHLTGMKRRCQCYL